MQPSDYREGWVKLAEAAGREPGGWGDRKPQVTETRLTRSSARSPFFPTLLTKRGKLEN